MSPGSAPQTSTKRRITALIVSRKTQHLCFNPLVTIDRCDTIKALVQKAMKLYVKQACVDEIMPAIISLHTKNAGQLATIADEDDLIEDVLGKEAQITILVADAKDLITFEIGRPLLQLSTPVPSKTPSLELNPHQHGSVKRLPKHLKNKKSSKEDEAPHKAMAARQPAGGSGKLVVSEASLPSAQPSKSSNRKRKKRLKLAESQQTVEKSKVDESTSTIINHPTITRTPIIERTVFGPDILPPTLMLQHSTPVLTPRVDVKSSQEPEVPTEFTELEEERHTPALHRKQDSVLQTLKRQRSRSPAFSTPSKRTRVETDQGTSCLVSTHSMPRDIDQCALLELKHDTCPDGSLQNSDAIVAIKSLSHDLLNSTGSTMQKNDKDEDLITEAPGDATERLSDSAGLAQTEDLLNPLTTETSVPLTEQNLEFDITQHEVPSAQKHSSIASSSVCSADFNQVCLVEPSQVSLAKRSESIGSVEIDLQQEHATPYTSLIDNEVPAISNAEAQADYASEAVSLQSTSTSDLDTDMEDLADFISISGVSSNADESVDTNKGNVQRLASHPEEEEVDTNSMKSASSNSQLSSDDESVAEPSDQNIITGLEKNKIHGFLEINAAEDMIDNDSIAVPENEYSSTSVNSTSPHMSFAPRPLLKSHNYKSLSFLHEQSQRNKDELSQIARPVGVPKTSKADVEDDDGGEVSLSDSDTSDSSAKSQGSHVDLPPEKRAKFVKKQQRLKRQSAGARALLAL